MLDACDRALRLAPDEYPPTPSPNQQHGAPEWYRFEHEAWKIGESLRQAFQKSRRLKNQPSILEKVIEVALCRNLRRGRQSFILALGFAAAKPYASLLTPLLSDEDVNGQVVSTLLKMKADEFANEVMPLVNAKKTWIRHLAERYTARYGKQV